MPIRLHVLLFVLVHIALAGPPFQTDDPEPVPLHHYEAYLFGLLAQTPQGAIVLVPATEFNYGAIPNLQLHVAAALAGNFTSAGPNQFGFADIEAGVKYRFVGETDRRPQVAIVPVLEIPSGNARRGLGNGRLWVRLPVWLQKSSGPWTTYGGGGIAINGAPGQRNFPFAGWLVQRQLSSRLTLGAEVFAHGATGSVSLGLRPPNSGSLGLRAATLLDAGGYYTFRRGFSLLFAAGHSVHGQAETYAYLGLYWTWGRARPRP